MNMAPTKNTYKDHYPPKQPMYDCPTESQNNWQSFSLPDGKGAGNSANK